MGMSQPMSILTSKETTSWYTPPVYVEMARTVFNTGIALDPASCHVAQSWIKADNYHTLERANDSGLDHSWYGNIWLNPPFDNTALWLKKTYQEIANGTVKQAMLLVNSNHGYKWYEELWRRFPVCCAKDRIEFLTDYDQWEVYDGKAKPCMINGHRLMTKGQAKRGQTFAYYGPNLELFYETFKTIGRVIVPKRG